LKQALPLGCVGGEDKPQHRKCDVIKQGAHWADDEHESSQIGQFPLAWLGQVVGINPVEGDAGL
jgi:hypothetical protein